MNAPLTKSSETCLVQRIGLEVGRELYGKQAQRVISGMISINTFSFTFPLQILCGSDSNHFFVKIPKTDLRVGASTILPLSRNDRLMAQEEENSLRILTKSWSADDLRVRWVTLRAFIPEFNAIVTDRIQGNEAYQVFRYLDIKRRLGVRSDQRRLNLAMSRIGGALRRFHDQGSIGSNFKFDQMSPKISFYCEMLNKETRNFQPSRTLAALNKFSTWESEAVQCNTLKGIDIRNVLVDQEGWLTMLDPGKTKFTFREADVARFLMTYRILYWGSFWLMLLRRPDQKAEISFLRTYYGGAEVPQILIFYLIKEGLKHWHTALDSLQRLSWPSLLKKLVAHVYVDRFYSRLIASDLEKLA